MACDADSKFYKNIVASSNKFATDLYKFFGSDEENSFFSPISIYVALALAYIGAKEKTAEEFINSMHLPENKDELLQGIRELVDLLKNPKLNVATEIFIEKSYKVKSDYKEAAKKFFDSESRLVDFIKASAAAEQLINAWVSTQTKEKIQNILPPGTLDNETRLVLVNAIHFKDDWRHQFKAYDTHDGDFHISPENTITVPMMNQTEKFKYLEKSDFKLLQLFYRDNSFSMVILLPKRIDGLKSIEEKLPSLDLNQLLDEANTCKVRVKLPKFKLEKFVDLSKILSKLGMGHMFSNDADFSGIFESTEDPIKVDKVLHKAFVEVNEEGTEAAAATAVCMARCLCAFEPPEPILDFYVDRPFVFFLLIQKVNMFVGHVSKPLGCEPGKTELEPKPALDLSKKN